MYIPHLRDRYLQFISIGGQHPIPGIPVSPKQDGAQSACRSLYHFAVRFLRTILLGKTLRKPRDWWPIAAMNDGMGNLSLKLKGSKLEVQPL